VTTFKSHHSSLPPSLPPSLSRLPACYDFFWGFSWVALLKIESDIFYPFLRKKLPKDLRPSLDELDEQRHQVSPFPSLPPSLPSSYCALLSTDIPPASFPPSLPPSLPPSPGGHPREKPRPPPASLPRPLLFFLPPSLPPFLLLAPGPARRRLGPSRRNGDKSDGIDRATGGGVGAGGGGLPHREGTEEVQ